MTTSSENYDFSLTTSILVTDLSKVQRGKQKHNVTIDFPGSGWKVRVTIPEAPTATSEEGNFYIGVWVGRPPKTTAESQRPLRASITLKADDIRTHEVYEESHFNWPESSDTLERGYGEFLPWKLFSGENPNTNHVESDRFRLTVAIHLASSLPSLRPYISDDAILANISQQLEGEEIVDTKFILFSRRLTKGDKCGAQDPLPVYTNSKFLGDQCDYFEAMFEDTWLNPKQPSDLYTDEYDYQSDSDLTSEYSEDGNDGSEKEEEREFSFSDDSKCVDNSDECKYDHVHINSEDEVIPAPAGIPTAKSTMTGIHSSDNSLIQRTPGKQDSKVTRDAGRITRTIIVKDTAYITFKAMVYYLYTSQITFAPLFDHGKACSHSKNSSKDAESLFPSAKSIYRLADKLGLVDLCELAEKHIESQLSQDRIIRELFCRFTSRYPSIRDMELAYFLKRWDKLKTTAEWCLVVPNIARGMYPHSADIIASIFNR